MSRCPRQRFHVSLLTSYPSLHTSLSYASHLAEIVFHTDIPISLMSKQMLRFRMYNKSYRSLFRGAILCGPKTCAMPVRPGRIW